MNLTLKYWLVAIAFIAGIGLFAVLMTYNLKTRESIPVEIDNANQITLLKQGRNPDISFVSLQPIPFASDIYNLSVDTHFSWGEGAGEMGTHLTKWLNKIGVKSFPDYSINN